MDMTVKNFDSASVVIAYCLFGRFRKVGVLGNKRQNNTVNTEFWIDLLLNLADVLVSCVIPFRGR